MTQEQLQKALESIGKSGINVAGDLVLEKNVQYEVNNVECGGIGIQINDGKHVPLSISDKDIKAAIKELQKASFDDEKKNPIFKNKKQWWAVFRVLYHFCNYPSQMTSFETKMKELEVAKVDGKRDLSYESLSAASKDVPKMATCSPDTWSALKDINDNYKQQYDVADFLMQKMGIKS